jgi:hypothetical protein
VRSSIYTVLHQVTQTGGGEVMQIIKPYFSILIGDRGGGTRKKEE